MLGEDFKKARSAWLYSQAPMQSFWRGVTISILVLVLWFILLQVFQGLVFGFGFIESAKLAYEQMLESGKWTLNLEALPKTVQTDLVRAVIMAVFPANLCAAFLVLALVKFGLPARAGKIPFDWPRISSAGWAVLIFSFVVVGYILFAVLGSAIGIDAQKNLGVVEQATMEMITSPRMFVLAVPGIVIGAPIFEELLFRGVLFAAIVQTPLGRVGAVFITALLWAGLHGGSESLFSVAMLFLLGIGLGLLLLRFGTIWVTIACHTAWNATFVFLAYVTSTHT